MPYRNPNPTRMSQQQATIFQYGGQTATWREYISASAGVSVAGFGTTPFYREQTVTALFKVVPLPLETQQPVGMIAAAEFQVTMRERVSRQDELRWKGDTYRVESDPSPAALPGTWLFTVKRGSNP